MAFPAPMGFSTHWGPPCQPDLLTQGSAVEEVLQQQICMTFWYTARVSGGSQAPAQVLQPSTVTL